MRLTFLRMSKFVLAFIFIPMKVCEKFKFAIIDNCMTYITLKQYKNYVFHNIQNFACNEL